MPKVNMKNLVWMLVAIGSLGLAVGQVRAQDPSQPTTTQPASGQPADPGAPTTAPAAPDPRYDSPRSTLKTFFDAMEEVQNEGLNNERRTRALAEAATCFNLGGLAEEAGESLAQDLQEILNRIGDLRSQLNRNIPDVERIEGRDEFTLFPSNVYWMHNLPGYNAVAAAAPNGLIALERNDVGEWRFSVETAEGLAEFKRLVGNLKAETGTAEIALTIDRKIEQMVPEVLKGGAILGLVYWKWIGLFTLIFAGMILDFSVRFLIRRTWRQIMRRRGQTPDKKLLQKAVRPFGLFASAMLFYWSVRLLGLPPTALTIVLAAVRVFLMLSTVWAAFRVTDLLGELLQSKAAGTATRFDDLLVPLVRKTFKIFISAIGLIYIADAFKIEIMPLLTGLGIGGLAFAFAAKDTIENFFGSVAVIVDRPFEVGDWVGIGDVEGTVEELGFRSTRVRTFYNSLVSVPNSTLVRATVDNYGRRRFRRYSTHIGITYDTPPEMIETFCEGVREIIRLHPYTRKDSFHVWLNRFGPSSLDVMLYVFHECPDWGTELRERQRLMLDIIRLANRLGVEFAFPTQTLHIAKDEAQDPHESHAPHAPGDTDDAGDAGGPGNAGDSSQAAEARAMRTGVDIVREMTKDASWRSSRPPVVTYGSTAPGAHGPLEAESE
jgi:MscS family membrane protein